MAGANVSMKQFGRVAMANASHGRAAAMTLFLLCVTCMTQYGRNVSGASNAVAPPADVICVTHGQHCSACSTWSGPGLFHSNLVFVCFLCERSRRTGAAIIYVLFGLQSGPVF